MDLHLKPFIIYLLIYPLKMPKEIQMKKDSLVVPNTPINDICNEIAYRPYIMVFSNVSRLFITTRHCIFKDEVKVVKRLKRNKNLL